MTDAASSHSHKMLFLSKIQRIEWSTQQSALALTNQKHDIASTGVQHLIEMLHFPSELI